MLQKIDDFLIDKVFQKIADFSFSYLGLSGVRVAHYILPFAIISLTIHIFVSWNDLFVAGLFLLIGVLHTAGEKRQLIAYENRLIEGARNVKRINSSFFFFRSAWCMFFIFDLLFIWVVDSLYYMFISNIFFALNQYFDATDINPPNKKKIFKLSFEQQ